MTVTDVLIGTNSVTVKRERRNADVEFTKEDDSTVLGLPDVHDDEVVNAITDAGFEFESQFPLEFNYHIHDESEPHNYREVSDKIGLPEDDELVQRIANIGYEVEFTIRVNDRYNWEVTHVFGKKLEEPKSYPSL